MTRRPTLPPDEAAVIAALIPWCNWQPSPRFPVGPGDDAALRICAEGEQLVFTGDTLVENIDFRLDWSTLDIIGERCIEVNASDVAAMGAQPDAAIVQVVFPPSCDPIIDIPLLYKGIGSACARHDMPVIGGDLSQGPCWMISITMTGRLAKGKRVLFRSGAQTGDGVFVTGHPGRSGAGLALLSQFGPDTVDQRFHTLLDAHRSPRARVREGMLLSTISAIHALTDVSDGIARECLSIATASGSGLTIDIEKNRIHPLVHDAAKLLGRDPLDFYLYGGEDFELLFTAEPSFDPTEADIDAIRIGTICCKEEGVCIVEENGTRKELEKKWYDHVRKQEI